MLGAVVVVVVVEMLIDRGADVNAQGSDNGN